MDPKELKANREFAERIKKSLFPNLPEPPMVDMRNAKVGQRVYAGTDWGEAGPGACGTIVEITPEGLVYVQCGARQKDGSWNREELLCFDANGRGTPESNINGPWHICHVDEIENPER
jgi:hypothetical protein